MEAVAVKSGTRRGRGLPRWSYAFLAAAAVLCSLFTGLNRELLELRPVYRIETAGEVCFGAGGGTLVIDDGKRSLLVLDAEGRLKARYSGGSHRAPFFYAAYAAQTEDGSIYVADLSYGQGSIVDRERILRLRRGKWETLYTVDYSRTLRDKVPLQYGRILELRAFGDEVYFLLDTVDALELRQIDGTGAVRKLAVIPAAGVKTDATYDPATRQAVVAWRAGGMLLYDLEEGTGRTLELGDGMMPFDLAALEGWVYYTEVFGHTVRRFSLADPGPGEVCCTLEALPYTLDADPSGQVLVTDQTGFYRLPAAGADPVYTGEARVAGFFRVVLAWGVLVLGGLCLLILLLRLLGFIVTAAMGSENVLRAVLIVAASLAVSFVLAYPLLDNLLAIQTQGTEKQIAAYSALLRAEIDEDALLTLDKPSDYGGAAFNAVKEVLDRHTWETYDTGDCDAYCVYRVLDGYVVKIMDFEDTKPCTYPLCADDPEDNLYARAAHTGEAVQATEFSASGSWSFILAPIRGRDGSIIGLLDVGLNLDQILARRREYAKELIVGILINTVVITMVLLELNFLLDHFRRRRQGRAEDSTQRVPLRTLVFLIYLADAMQDVFIAVLCGTLYQCGLPVPHGVAVALPMSAQLLMMAVFSLLSGGLAERFGSRAVMIPGMLLDLAGFLLCMLLGSYAGLLLGKMLIGAGMGLVYVSCSTVAATGKNGALVAEANAAISAGTLAGVTIGAGLASMLFTLGGWRIIYLAGAVILAVGLLLAVSSGDVRPGRGSGEREAARAGSFCRFFLQRRVWGFFLLILVPFMMSLAYREYFFPLFSAERGVSEVRIGQIYLLCGMLTLYVGPLISARMIRRMGANQSVMVCSAAVGLDLLIVVLFPTLWGVILGLMILSLINSHAFACQYTCYELMPEVAGYGEGRAMGVYSVFESLGQTLGPIAYGALLTLGNQGGISLFSGAMLLLMLLYAALMFGRGRRNKEQKGGHSP